MGKLLDRIMELKMPTVSIYIKNEDYSKYLGIENKSEFIHKALNTQKPLNTDGSVYLKDGLVHSKPITPIPGSRDISQDFIEGNPLKTPKVVSVKRKGKSVPFSQKNDIVEFDTGGHKVT